MSLPTPYYDEDGIVIFNADCREILPHIEADVIVTDPPYGISWGQYGRHGWVEHAGIQNDLDTSARDRVLDVWGNRPAIVFGSQIASPPAGIRQVLVWQKPIMSGFFGSIGGWRRDWEAIFLLGAWQQTPAERSSIITTHGSIAQYTAGFHPHAKPLSLMMRLVDGCAGTVLDPFMGSGTTLVAAQRLGRCAIGVEIEESYCRIAVERLRQTVMRFDQPRREPEQATMLDGDAA